jgi:6-phosphofructokinase 1
MKVAISTGGGDAPGLNAVIRAIVLAGTKRGWDIVGVRDGYNGLLTPERYPKGGVVTLTPDGVRGMTHQEGTIIGTTNRGDPRKFPVKGADGRNSEVDRTDELLAAFAKEGIDALISCGGDGSLAIANTLHQRGLRVIGDPKTIDNDLDGTVITFGFDTAVAFATECLDRLHTTAASHGRVIVVEVMGRYAGWIATNAGHLLRGGSPTMFDRVLSLLFGAAAVRALEDGRSGVMVGLDPPTVKYVPLEEATRRMKTVPLDCDTILTARDLGICPPPGM